MYLEPVVVEAQGREVLLAGKPSYVWASSDSGLRFRPETQLFGVVVQPTGKASVVRSPLPHAPIAPLAASRLVEGGWGVIVAEYARSVAFLTDDTPLKLWYAVYDGVQWREVEPIPYVPTRGLILYDRSRLVVAGDTLAWAVPHEGNDRRQRVLFFERRAGQWSRQVIQTRNAGATALIYSDSVGFTLGIVHTDSTLPRDENSFFVYVRSPRWRQVRKLVAGFGQPVYGPTFEFSRNEAVLSWWTLSTDTGRHRREARASLGGIFGDEPRVLQIDSPVLYTPAFVTTSHGRRLWISSHVTNTGDRELRIFAEQRNRAVLLMQIPDPYHGHFRATSLPDGQLLVAGPDFDSSAQTLSTLLLRFRVECRDPEVS